MKYTKFDNAAGDSNITVLYDGELYSTRSDNPHWDQILEGVKAQDPAVIDLFKPADAISKKFAELTERISVHKGNILWDGEPIHNSLTKKIIALMDERREDWRPLVEFMENLYANPNEHSREQAFEFLEKNDYTILANGNFLAYKGVNVAADGTYLSDRTGNAIVNDEQLLNQQIPNQPGSIIRMPRADVRHEPNSPCHVGLHVATFDFAKGFIGHWKVSAGTGAVLEVEVNPRDIVSVPNGGAKMRVCRYRVIRPVTEPTTATFAPDVPEAAPVLVTGGDEIAPDEPAEEPVRWDRAKTTVALPATKADDGTVTVTTPGANIPEATEAPRTSKRRNYPREDEFTKMQGRAKRRRRNFQKYAEKHGPWTLFGDDPTNRKHWEK